MDEDYVIIKIPKIEREEYIEMQEFKSDVTLEPIVELEKLVVTVEEPVVTVEEPEVNGLVLLSVSSLTEYQKQIALTLYDSIKHAIHEYMADNSINNIIKITMMLGKMIQLIEKVKIKDKIPTGNDKKAVVIELGRILIKEMTSNVELLLLYDVVAETTLETMIRVSKSVNVEIVTKCCSFF